MVTEDELKKLKRKSAQAFMKYQQATQEYHWTEADDGAKWKHVVTLQKADAEAFQRYTEALNGK